MEKILSVALSFFGAVFVEIPRTAGAEFIAEFFAAELGSVTIGKKESSGFAVADISQTHTALIGAKTEELIRHTGFAQTVAGHDKC